MKKLFLILLVLIMVSGMVFAEETKEASFELPKYTTADKVAITVFTVVAAVVVTIVTKEIVVDGAYGTRD